MGYREARELARIRIELRERLGAGHVGVGGTDDTAQLLARLARLARDHRADCPELPGEYERWRTRFETPAHLAG